MHKYSFLVCFCINIQKWQEAVGGQGDISTIKISKL